MSARAGYSVVDTLHGWTTIRDLDRGGVSVTNDAEAVVEELVARGLLPPGRRLRYFDSDGRLDEIVLRDGRFVGFAPHEYGPES